MLPSFPQQLLPVPITANAGLQLGLLPVMVWRAENNSRWSFSARMWNNPDLKLASFKKNQPSVFEFVHNVVAVWERSIRFNHSHLGPNGCQSWTALHKHTQQKQHTGAYVCVHVQEACDNLRLDWFPLRESEQTGKQIYSLISIWLACRCSLIGLHLSVPADIRRGQQMCVLLNWLHDLNKQAVEMLCGLHTHTHIHTRSNIKHNLYVNMRLCQRTKWF